MEEEIDYSKIILHGDNILVEPLKGNEDSFAKIGVIYVPKVQQQQKLEPEKGYVIKTGPGYVGTLEEDVVSNNKKVAAYIPLEAQPGDLLYFVKGSQMEFIYKGKRLWLVKDITCLFCIREPF